MQRQRGQPCQKQPSRKMATRARVKTTYGPPVKPERCPSLHPLTPERIRRDRNFHSVDLDPFDRLRLMTRERVSASNLSKNCPRRIILPIRYAPRPFRATPLHGAL